MKSNVVKIKKKFKRIIIVEDIEKLKKGRKERGKRGRERD